MAFRWRPRFYQLLYANASSQASLYDAAVAIADLMPRLEASGVLALATSIGSSSSDMSVGPWVKWQSESSPALLSPQQVVQWGGSCTGTALTMLAAYRSVGIPARIAGCSNEYINGEWANVDHHWVEFWDSTLPGPFDDEPQWHTK